MHCRAAQGKKNKFGEYTASDISEICQLYLANDAQLQAPPASIPLHTSTHATALLSCLDDHALMGDDNV
jgi:hypothetical protein